MKGNIKDVFKLWNKVGSPDYIYDGIRLDNANVNIVGLPVGTYDDVTLVIFYSKMLGVAMFSKMGG